jgi:hypothetical protein
MIAWILSITLAEEPKLMGDAAGSSAKTPDKGAANVAAASNIARIVWTR